MKKRRNDMKIYFRSFASGSSGNCYYLGTDRSAILIDAGIGIRTIRKHFKEAGMEFEKLRAVFVTHDHADHIKAVGHLANRFHLPVYATPEVHKGMQHSYCMSERLSAPEKQFITKEESLQIDDFRVTCFEIPHDGTDNVGYCIEVGGLTFSFLTDIGHITETAARYIERTNYLVMEANYDEAMLQMGPYPAYLKARIAGPNGHLSNREMAEHLAEHFPVGLRCVWPCHLSKDNNHPELVLKTIEMAFREKGIVVGRDVQVIPLRRMLPSDLYVFDGSNGCSATADAVLS